MEYRYLKCCRVGTTKYHLLLCILQSKLQNSKFITNNYFSLVISLLYLQKTFVISTTSCFFFWWIYGNLMSLYFVFFLHPNELNFKQPQQPWTVKWAHGFGKYVLFQDCTSDWFIYTKKAVANFCWMFHVVSSVVCSLRTWQQYQLSYQCPCWQNKSLYESESRYETGLAHSSGMTRNKSLTLRMIVEVNNY